jgi:hypothetical protein
MRAMACRFMHLGSSCFYFKLYILNLDAARRLHKGNRSRGSAAFALTKK